MGRIQDFRFRFFACEKYGLAHLLKHDPMLCTCSAGEDPEILKSDMNIDVSVIVKSTQQFLP